MVTRNKKLIFTSMSKKVFYFKDHVLQFVIKKGYVPITPWAVGYFLLDTVPRNKIRDINNTLVERADEVWVFGEMSNGVINEIRLAEKLKKPVKYFEIVDSKSIRRIPKTEAKEER